MKTATAPTSGLDPLLSIEELAEYLGVPVTTIYDWLVDGKGPCEERNAALIAAPDGSRRGHRLGPSWRNTVRAPSRCAFEDSSGSIT